MGGTDVPSLARVLALVGAAIGSYLLGGIPMGYLIASQRGVDITRVGSGNTGATNVYRNMGAALGFLVLGGDLVKGLLAASIGRLVLPGGLGEVVCGLAAIIGHNWSVFMRFRGGKGMATSAGVVALTVPMSALVLVPIWFVVVSLSGYVSLGSISVAVLLPVAVWLVYPTRTWNLVFAIIAGAMAVWRHRTNIQRLLRGNENRLSGR